jgi:Flp pilus assembly pilin Flp
VASTYRPPGINTGTGSAEIGRKGGELVALRSSLRALATWLDRDDRGQGLAEYALILALIALIAISALAFMGTQLSNELSQIGASVDSVIP